ncbi:putative quinol monooxygenase [Metabacillus sp. RGM 3146]|uniref:putative quinol monooxygenase n=1 Tax=Metabacillus sp. RGM 3146 TaxID=3401092 RepID=UPI003B9C84C3
MANISITAFLTAKPGKEEALLNELKKVLEPSRKEAGCIQYDLHQSKEDEGLFIFYETWKDQAALDSHSSLAHYKSYREATEPLVAKREVYLLDKISL